MSVFAERIKTACPRDCYDSCGMIADRSTGKLRILGDPDHHLARGSLCQKCAIAYNSAWLDPAARVKAPLKRVGRKGEGKFAPVSWDAAIGDIASHLRESSDKGEAHRIVNTHYTGTFSLLAFWVPWRIFDRASRGQDDGPGRPVKNAPSPTTVRGSIPQLASRPAMWR